MKRRGFLLLICFLYLFFFVGKSDVYGLTCKVGEAGCTEDAIEKELNENGKELACLYEMTIDGGEVYYNYISYDRKSSEGTGASADNSKNKNVFAAHSTHGISWPFHDYKYNDDPRRKEEIDYSKIIYGYDGKDLKSCPKNSYLMLPSTDATFPFACFDDNGQCLKYSNEVSVYKNGKSKLVFDGGDSILFKITDRYTKYVNNDDFCIYNVPESAKNSWVIYSKNKNAVFVYDVELKKKYTSGLPTSTVAHFNYYHKLEVNSSSGSCLDQLYYYKFKENGQTSYTYLITDTLYSDRELLKTFVLYNKNDIPSVPDSNEVSCEIFDDNLREIINGVMDIIRIAIPLLLIGLIGVDFCKAIFASDDKAISKAKKNAITRIIIAIVIYFVPTLINLVFNIANDVWANVHYEICVLGEKDNNN